MSTLAKTKLQTSPDTIQTRNALDKIMHTNTSYSEWVEETGENSITRIFVLYDKRLDIKTLCILQHTLRDKDFRLNVYHLIKKWTYCPNCMNEIQVSFNCIPLDECFELFAVIAITCKLMFIWKVYRNMICKFM